MSEIKKFSRRQFGKYSLASAGSLALAGIETRNVLSQIENKPTGNIESEIIKGVEVFGLKSPLKTSDEFIQFEKKLNQNIDLQIKQLYPDLLQNPKNRFEKYRLIAPLNERLLQLSVTKRVWEKFAQGAEQGGLDLLDWIDANITEMNRKIQTNPYPVDLKTVLKRVIVVDDSLAEDPKKNPPPMSVGVDGNWFMDFDYRGDIHPQTKNYTASGFIRSIKKNGNNVLIDEGLIHEWMHQLYNWPDEYVQDLHEKDPQLKIPDLTVNGGLEGDSAWAGAFLQKIKAKNVRGYYTDERGIGVRQSKDRSDNITSVWGELPENSNIALTYLNNEPLMVPVAFYRSHSSSPNYYKDKYLQKTQVAASSELPIQLDKGLFIPDKFDNETAPVLNISVGLPNDRFIHIPIGAFNLAKWAGEENPSFKIQILNPNQESERRQLMHYVSEANKSEFEKDKSILAQMLIPGTSIYCIWVK